MNNCSSGYIPIPIASSTDYNYITINNETNWTIPDGTTWLINYFLSSTGGDQIYLKNNNTLIGYINSITQFRQTSYPYIYNLSYLSSDGYGFYAQVSSSTTKHYVVVYGGSVIQPGEDCRFSAIRIS